MRNALVHITLKLDPRLSDSKADSNTFCAQQIKLPASSSAKPGLKVNYEALGQTRPINATVYGAPDE